jgi:hypothetical protein
VCFNFFLTFLLGLFYTFLFLKQILCRPPKCTDKGDVDAGDERCRGREADRLDGKAAHRWPNECAKGPRRLEYAGDAAVAGKKMRIIFLDRFYSNLNLNLYDFLFLQGRSQGGRGFPHRNEILKLKDCSIFCVGGQKTFFLSGQKILEIFSPSPRNFLLATLCYLGIF